MKYPVDALHGPRHSGLIADLAADDPRLAGGQQVFDILFAAAHEIVEHHDFRDTLERSWSAMWEPMSPAPPVMRTRLPCSSILFTDPLLLWIEALPPAQETGRYTGHDCKGLYIPDDHRPGPDNAAVAHRHAGKQGAVGGNISLCSDADRTHLEVGLDDGHVQWHPGCDPSTLVPGPQPT